MIVNLLEYRKESKLLSEILLSSLLKQIIKRKNDSTVDAGRTCVVKRCVKGDGRGAEMEERAVEIFLNLVLQDDRVGRQVRKLCRRHNEIYIYVNIMGIEIWRRQF